MGSEPSAANNNQPHHPSPRTIQRNRAKSFVHLRRNVLYYSLKRSQFAPETFIQAPPPQQKDYALGIT